MQVRRVGSGRYPAISRPSRVGLNGLAKRSVFATQHIKCIQCSQSGRKQCVQFRAEPSTLVSVAQSFVAAHSTVIAVLLGACVMIAALIRTLKEGSRKYDGNVGEEYDAWTREGILEYYWGEHIHLGYYSEQERQPGFFAWGKTDFKKVRSHPLFSFFLL